MILTSIPWLPKLYTQSHIYKHTYILIQAHSHIHKRISKPIHYYTHVFKYISYTHVQTYTFTYTNIYIHAQIHTNTHIHILCKSHYTQALIQLIQFFQSWASGFYYFQSCLVIWKFITQNEFLKYSFRTSKIKSSDGPL